MSCTPEQVTGYVDEVLDPQAREVMEAHLGACPACRDQADFERELRAGLKALPEPELRPGFEEQVRRRLAADRRRRSAWLLPLAASLALLALWGRGAAPFVAWELSRDHAKCFGKDRLPAKVWSNDPGEITRWFESQGTAMPPLPAEAGGLALVGARYCPLLDRFVAHVYYADDKRELSLFVLSGPARFERAWRGRSRGRAVHLLRSAGRTVALVADRSEDVDAFHAAFATTVAGSPARPETPPRLASLASERY